MATHSSVLAWRIQGTGEPGGLPSMGSHRVGHDGSDLAAAAAPEQTPSPSNTREDSTHGHHHMVNTEIRLITRRGLTPRGSLECNPEIPAFPGEEN